MASSQVLSPHEFDLWYFCMAAYISRLFSEAVWGKPRPAERRGPTLSFTQGDYSGGCFLISNLVIGRFRVSGDYCASLHVWNARWPKCPIPRSNKQTQTIFICFQLNYSQSCLLKIFVFFHYVFFSSLLQLNKLRQFNSFFNLSQNLIAILCWFKCFLQIGNLKLFYQFCKTNNTKEMKTK